MTRMSQNALGRARAVLVSGQGAGAKAVVTTVSARLRRNNSRKRLRGRGPVCFEEELLRHIESTVLPIVDRLASVLTNRRRQPAYDLSITNSGAASVFDRGMRVNGFSADGTVFLALLSPVLGLPVPQWIVCTAHVASPEGELRPVRNMPAKLEAASKEPDLRTFVYAAPDTDQSLRELVPDLAVPLIDVERDAGSALERVSVADVAQLTRMVFDDNAILCGSLKLGYFELAQPLDDDGSIVSRVAALLTEELEQRFWRVLEAQLLHDAAAQAKQLIELRARYHIRRRQYPGRFGHDLFSLLQAMPPSVLRLRRLFPLLPAKVCLALASVAVPTNYEDVDCLFRAVAGRITREDARSRPTAAAPESESSAASQIVATVLDEIRSETLTRMIGLPIDAARAAFTLSDITTESADDLQDVVSAYYLFALRHLGQAPSQPNMRYRGDAIDLLQRTFANEGGLPAACEEARDGTRGGLRFILDAVTARLKHEQQADHVRYVIETAVSSRTFEERRAIAEALYAVMRPHLPPDLRTLPVAQLAHHLAEVVEAYVKSMDHVKTALRRF